MGVYIKGMEMPKSCSDCPILDWDLDYIKCKVAGRHFKVKEEPFAARRVDDCPLVTVPPHGRLIDADALLDDLLFPSKQFEQGMRELIGDAPTVIPAEPPKDEAPAGLYDLLYEEGGPDA